jgi:hypothetical protein
VEASHLIVLQMKLNWNNLLIVMLKYKYYKKRTYWFIKWILRLMKSK